MFYGIGLTPETVTDLADLPIPVPYPKSEPPWAETEELGDGHLRQVGPLRTLWHLPFLEADQNGQMRSFCPGASATVYVSTRLSDDTYVIYESIMRWARENAREAGLRPNVDIEYILIAPVELGS